MTLSTDEKLQLIHEIYDGMASEGELEPNPAVVAELQSRREEYLRDPSQVVAWNAVRRKLADGAWRR